MKTKMVSYTLETLPPLTGANASRRSLYRPLKRQITARVDADVLDWLKGQGKGYQSRINAILRREMLETAKR